MQKKKVKGKEKWEITRYLHFYLPSGRVTETGSFGGFGPALVERSIDLPFVDPATDSKFLLQELDHGYSLTHTTPSRIVLVTFPKEIDWESWVKGIEAEDRSWEKLLDKLPMKTRVLTSWL